MTITADQITAVVNTVPTGLYIDGTWRQTEARIEVENPATGQLLTTISDGAGADATEALDAAVAAASSWADTSPRERSDILRRAFELLRADATDLALLMTAEMGKPLAESLGEVAYGAEFFRHFSDEAVRVAGRYQQAPSAAYRILTVKQPVGPVFAITPWNFPLAMATRKIGPALAAGCPVIVKPATLTPLTTLKLVDLLAEAGVPAGVVNVLTSSSSSSLSAALLADDRLRKLTFTGSTEVGRHLLAQAADKVLRVSMELGGNAPLLVFADADLEVAVDGAVAAKMRNTGQACTAANRLLVAESIAEEFTARLTARMAAMPVGPGWADGVQVGPLVDAASRDKVSGLVADATDRGARVLTGGHALAGPGYFYEPTVLADLNPDARVFREEIFGPVAPVFTFTTEAQAIELANDTEYGLMGYVFTSDLGRAFRVSEALETGMVGVNNGVISNAAAPFGGVKQSGIGKEGGAEGIDEYLAVKYIGLGW